MSGLRYAFRTEIAWYDKVVCHEKWGGSRRWQTSVTVLRRRWSRDICPSNFIVVFSSTYLRFRPLQQNVRRSVLRSLPIGAKCFDARRLLIPKLPITVIQLYWPETETDDAKVKKETNVDHQCPRLIPPTAILPIPTFSSHCTIHYLL